MASTITATDAGVVTNATGDPVTFTSLASGTAAADRVTVVAFSHRNRNLATGVTINGIAATKAFGSIEPVSTITSEIWYAANPSGTTATVVLTFGNANSSNIGHSVFAVYGAYSATPSDTDGNQLRPGSSISISLTIETDGVAIFAGSYGDQSTGVSWTNATENQDSDATSFRVSSAYSTTPGTPTVTMTGLAGEPYALAGASWSPTAPVIPTTPTYFGSASVPTDAGQVNATTTLTITPPTSMLTGDLVVVNCESTVSATWSVGVTGGQTWTSETAYQGAAAPFCRLFWCRFNGTWGANPRFDSTVGTATTAVMHVFRPYDTARLWAIDVAQATTQFGVPTTPFTVTRTGLTTAHADTVTLAIWNSSDDQSWTSLAGSGWVVTGSAQYRNTSGTDQSCSFAHHLDSTAGTIVPNVSKNQSVVTGDAGVTAIIAWYAYTSGAALTKAVADGLTMSDVRSGIAQYLRGLPDAMTLAEAFARAVTYLRAFADPFTVLDAATAVKPGAALTKGVADPLTLAEALARIAALQRYSMDPLTMGETIAAVRALVRSCIDPLTLGENLATAKALIRAYADAIILGEVFDKQILMAAFSDNFNRADSATPGASWNENVTGVSIIGNGLGFINTGNYSSVVWTQAVAVSCQYQRATVSWNPGTANRPGMMFRCSNTSNGSCYQVSFDTATDTVYWDNCPNMTAPATGTNIGTATLAIAPNNVIGMTLELLGNNTILRIWKNPSGLPSRANNWNGDTTPDVTMTQNPATPRDTGTFLGLFGAPLEAAADLKWDDWFGGGCLESTGVLWTKDLFDSLVVSEALAKVATLFRANVDPITLAEAMIRVAALQRYSADAITVAENVVTARALARSYLDALTLGEALSKRPGKLYADTITLGEAFAKQLQVARNLADPMTVGEALAKQAQFRRSQIDPIALNESLAKQMQIGTMLSDVITLGEVFTKLVGSKSVADPLLLNEALKKQINRGLGDLISMSEALVKFSSKTLGDLITLSEALTKALTANRSFADPIVLSEAFAKQKEIGKALAEVIAIGEVLTKVFTGIRSLVDPIVLGETVAKQVLGAGARAVADVITMAGNAFTQLQAVRAMADPITLGEAVARQAQFKRSLADLMTLGEALQKALGLVRSISNPIILGETVAKSSAFARSQADPITLSEAVAKLLGIARSLSDSITLGEALAKSATFRRSMADVMTLADSGSRTVLRQLLADSLTIADLAVASKVFLRLYADPITMGDTVTKLFVLLRVLTESISLGERLIRVMAYHRLPVDTISLAEVFAKVATYKRTAADPLTLGEAFNEIAALRRSAVDPLVLGEAIQSAKILKRGQADPISLADVIETRIITFVPAWARRPYNVGTGGVICH